MTDLFLASAVVGCSACLQAMAMVVSLRLIRVTGRRVAWLALSVGLGLMAVRRGIAFAGMISSGVVPQPFVQEWVALLISFLLLVGLIAAPRALLDFGRIQASKLAMEKQVHDQQKMESLGRMAGGLAHSINNHLQSIVGNIELAKLEATESSEQVVSLDQALESTRAVARLSNEILMYTGRSHHHHQPVSICSTLASMEPMIRSVIPDNIALELNLKDENAMTMAHDPDIRHAVLNLVFNAVESIAGRKGSITITTGLSPCTCRAVMKNPPVCWLQEAPRQGRTHCMIRVEDDGPGVPEHLQDRIFDPFFTTKFEGRGLGLSSVLGIVRNHNGCVRVIRNGTKGVAFDLLFPVYDRTPQENPPAPAAANRNEPRDMSVAR